MSFSIAEKFRLEAHWQKVVYEQSGIAKLEGCYFGGPALKEITDVNQKDHIVLDFMNQYILVMKDYYVADLSWDGVNRTTDKIILSNVILSNKNINSVPPLNNDDYIVVDTSNHISEKHQHFLTYASYLIRFDGEKYDFRR
jgi:hypothetical protein